MSRVIFHPLARRELRDAAAFYEKEVPGLGKRFLDHVERAAAFVKNHPEASVLIARDVRRYVLPRFPYSLIYTQLHGGSVEILAVMHQHRHPAYWTDRMR